MKGYILDYINENEFKKLERALKKYNMLAFKKLNFDYYPALRNGNFVGELVSVNKKNGTEKYELKLPSDRMFAQIHGEVKLIYTVHKHEERIVLETITPSEILLEGHRSELTTYKGIMISKQNASKDKFKIDLLTKLQDKMMLFIAVLTLIILVGGATFAYFTAQGGNGAQTNMSVTTHTTDSLVFEVGKPISIQADYTNFKEGMDNRTDSTLARATLKANSSTNDAIRHYYIYLDITTNEFKYTTTAKTAELILTVLDPDDNPVTSINGLNYVTVDGVSGFDVTELTGLQELISNYEIHSTGTEIDEWDITLTLINLDSDQNANTGKMFNATLKIQEESQNVATETLSNHIIGLYTTQGSNNLYHHDGTLENGINDGSYRYAGSYETTNNWVCFGTDAEECDDEHLYRIIGVFDSVIVDDAGNTTTKTEQRVKLIKAYEGTEASLGTAPHGNGTKDATYYKGKLDSTPGYYWSGSSSNQSNNWTTSALNTNILNGTYLTTLGTNWTDKIAMTEWKIGGNTYLNIVSQNAATAYQNEVVSPATNIVSNPKYNAKIGLMYASDYGFAASPAKWTTTLYLGYNNDTNRNNNWLFMGIYEWTISPFADYSNRAFLVDSDGGVNYSYVSHSYGVRPSFSLESSTTYAGGTGTESNPYRIAL